MFPEGEFYILSRKHGFALDVYDGQTKEDANIIVWPQKFQDSNNQLWSFENSRLINKKSGLALDISSSAFRRDKIIVQKKARGNKQSQEWVYDQGYICSKEYPAYVMDIRGNSEKGGSQILLYKRKDSDNMNQLWHFESYHQFEHTLNMAATSLPLHKSEGFGQPRLGYGAEIGVPEELKKLPEDIKVAGVDGVVSAKPANASDNSRQDPALAQYGSFYGDVTTGVPNNSGAMPEAGKPPLSGYPQPSSSSSLGYPPSDVNPPQPGYPEPSVSTGYPPPLSGYPQPSSSSSLGYPPSDVNPQQPGYPEPSVSSGYPSHPNNMNGPPGYPSPSVSTSYPSHPNNMNGPPGYPSPSVSTGYPPRPDSINSPPGYPQPSASTGYPQLSTSTGYPPRPDDMPLQSPGYPQPSVSTGYPPNNMPGYPQPSVSTGYPPSNMPKQPPGYPEPSASSGYPPPISQQPGYLQPSTSSGFQLPIFQDPLSNYPAQSDTPSNYINQAPGYPPNSHPPSSPGHARPPQEHPGYPHYPQ